MSKVIKGSVFSSSPGTVWKSKVRALIRAGNYDSAIEQINKEFHATEKKSYAWYLLADIYNKQGDFPAALAAIDESLNFKTNDKKLNFKAIILSNMKEYGRSIPLAHELYSRNKEDISLVNILKIGHFNTGNIEKAIKYGRKSLELWDKKVGTKQEDFLKGHDIGKKKGNKKIVSYSLWGKGEKYNIGAMVNARLVQSMLPGWVCRFYVGNDVPKDTVTDLIQMGAEIALAEKAFPDIPRYSWRFVIADDPAVDYFLCRDCDSRLSPKEVAAVQEWLNSGQTFHIMRDHIMHSDLILGGMWGGSGGTGINIREKILNPDKNHRNFSYYADQVFLAQEIWPLIRSHSFIHDSYYDLFNSRPFPLYGKGTNSFHVGGGIKHPQILQNECKRYGISYPL